jgi:hypothetical protein
MANSSDSALPLIAVLLDAFEGSGTGMPTMPAGKRNDTIAFLTRMMTDQAFFTTHMQLIRTERERHGAAFKRKLLSHGGYDIPDKQIIREGFSGLSDELLADLAISPEALEALEDVFYGGELDTTPGPWFFANESSNKVESAKSPSDASIIPSTQPRKYRVGKWTGWSVAGIVLAASFLLGVFVGPKINGKKQPEFAFANVTVQGDITRGVEDIKLLVTNGGDGRAFVTVVGLVPGKKRAAVFNSTQGEFLTVPAHETVTINNLPTDEFEGTTVALLILTEVPAGEAVRQSLPASVSLENAMDLSERLRQKLLLLNIRAEIRVVNFPVSKK